jgi:hypothetical protein
MEPFGVFEAIRQLRAHTDLDLEMHAHDDLGLATANTLAAAVAGATHLNTTVNGLGERAGNARLEEVVLGLRQLYGIETGYRAARFSLTLRRRRGKPRVNPWVGAKSLVGKRVFSHEARSMSTGCTRIRPITRASTRRGSVALIRSCWAAIPARRPWYRPMPRWASRWIAGMPGDCSKRCASMPCATNAP